MLPTELKRLLETRESKNKAKKAETPKVLSHASILDKLMENFFARKLNFDRF
jgi:hypothetical protein